MEQGDFSGLEVNGSAMVARVVCFLANAIRIQTMYRLNFTGSAVIKV